MSRLPDLVHDTRLNTSFKDNTTIHYYDESDDENDARSTWRSEHWEQTNHLGHGSYGDVWLQQCVSGKRGYERRAVKIIPRLRLKDKKDSYMAELEAIAKFSQRRYSKCFVKLLGWYDTDSSLYIAIEYAPLGDLEKYMSNNGPMQEGDAQQVSFQILEGLSYMHREGFAHRDIKPANVLIKSQPPKSRWWVKIGDFGISKRLEGSMAQSTVRGTIQYMAPELIWHEAGNSINYMAAGMWALGTMVYRMLTLVPVFSTPGAYNYYLVNVDSFPLEELKRRDASSDAILFIRSLMGPRPEERLASDKAMEHAWVASFRSHQAQIPTSPEPTTPNGYSASRQSAPTSNLNPWATISTRSTESSIEAQQPRATFTESAPPTSAPQPPATTASRFEQNRERQRQLELHNAGREGDMPRRATRAPAAFTREKQTLVRPRSDSTTNASSPTPSVEFIDNRLPVDDVFKNNVHYDWELQEYIESQPSRSRDNSRAYSREQIDRANPQRPMILQPRVKQYTKQGSRRFDGYYVRIMKRDSFERSAYWLNTVIAENIATTTNNAEIKDFFSSCGKITKMAIISAEGMTKTAQVTFEKKNAVKTALLLNNTQLGPNDITVASASSDDDTEQGIERDEYGFSDAAARLRDHFSPSK